MNSLCQLSRCREAFPLTVRVACFVSLCVAPASCRAQLALERFYPPAVARGETAVTAEGKFPDWPPEVVCDRDEVTFVAGEKPGQWTIEVAQDAAPGVAWVRMFDRQSASGLVPLVLASVDVSAEAEPNDKRTEASELSLPAVACGKLQKNGDSDAFRVSLKQGEQMIASVTAHRVLGSPMDAVLQLTDNDGNILAQSDDDRGLDPQLVYTADEDCRRILRVFAFPETPNSTVGFSGAASFIYTIAVTTGPFIDHASADSGGEIELSGYNLTDEIKAMRSAATKIAPATAFARDALGWSWLAVDGPQKIRRAAAESVDRLPVTFCGRITQPREVHSFRLSAESGKKYRAQVRSKPDGFLLDSELVVVELKSGRELARNDDLSRGQYDASVEFAAKEQAELEIRLSDVVGGFGPRHFYRLTIEAQRPRYRLSVSSDHFSIQPGGTTEIPVTITRQSGHQEKVSVVAEGLPPGVTAEPVVSDPKAKSVKLKLMAEEGTTCNGAFRISGTVPQTDADGEPVSATFSLRPEIALTEFWLTAMPHSPDEKPKP